MGYDWNGARGRRMKIARIGTAVALAALLVSVATEVVTRAIYRVIDDGYFGGDGADRRAVLADQKNTSWGPRTQP